MSSLSTPSANGTQNANAGMPTQVAARILGGPPAPARAIECRQMKAWFVGEHKVIEEVGRNKYDLCDYYSMSLDNLRRLHAVLAEVLREEERLPEGFEAPF